MPRFLLLMTDITCVLPTLNALPRPCLLFSPCHPEKPGHGGPRTHARASSSDRLHVPFFACCAGPLLGIASADELVFHDWASGLLVGRVEGEVSKVAAPTQLNANLLPPLIPPCISDFTQYNLLDTAP